MKKTLLLDKHPIIWNSAACDSLQKIYFENAFPIPNICNTVKWEVKFSIHPKSTFSDHILSSVIIEKVNNKDVIIGVEVWRDTPQLVGKWYLSAVFIPKEIEKEESEPEITDDERASVERALRIFHVSESEYGTPKEKLSDMKARIDTMLKLRKTGAK